MSKNIQVHEGPCSVCYIPSGVSSLLWSAAQSDYGRHCFRLIFFFFRMLDNSKQFLSSHFCKKKKKRNDYWYFRKGQILSVITQKLGSCKFSSTLLPLLYFTFCSAILFNGINFSIAFTLCFVTKCTRFTLSPKLTIQLLIQIRKLSHEGSTSEEAIVKPVTTIFHMYHFSVWLLTSSLLLFCFVFLTFELHRVTRKCSINKICYIISSTELCNDVRNVWSSWKNDLTPYQAVLSRHHTNALFNRNVSKTGKETRRRKETGKYIWYNKLDTRRCILGCHKT